MTWTPMTKREKIDWLAEKVMGWKPKLGSHPDFTLLDDRFDPFTDHNHAASVRDKMKQKGWVTNISRSGGDAIYAECEKQIAAGLYVRIKCGGLEELATEMEAVYLAVNSKGQE